MDFSRSILMLLLSAGCALAQGYGRQLITVVAHTNGTIYTPTNLLEKNGVVTTNVFIPVTNATFLLYGKTNSMFPNGLQLSNGANVTLATNGNILLISATAGSGSTNITDGWDYSISLSSNINVAGNLFMSGYGVLYYDQNNGDTFVISNAFQDNSLSLGSLGAVLSWNGAFYGNGFGLTNLSNMVLMAGGSSTNQLLISPTNSSPISTNATFYAGAGANTNVATFYGNTVHAGRAAFGANAGSATFADLLELLETVTNATANNYGFRSTITYSPTNPTDAYWYSAELGEAITGGTNNLAVVRGNYGYVRHDNDKTLTNAWSHWGVVRANNSSTVNSGAGFKSSPYVDGDGRILNYYHFQAEDVTDTSTRGVGDQYGLYIPSLTGATNNYSIYAGTAPSYFYGTLNAKGDLNCYSALTLSNNIPLKWMNAAGSLFEILKVTTADNVTFKPPTGGDINIGPNGNELMIKNTGSIVGKWGSVFYGNGSGLTNITSTFATNSIGGAPVETYMPTINALGNVVWTNAGAGDVTTAQLNAASNAISLLITNNATASSNNFKLQTNHVAGIPADGNVVTITDGSVTWNTPASGDVTTSQLNAASNALSLITTQYVTATSNLLQQSMSNTVDYASNVVWVKAEGVTNNTKIARTDFENIFTVSNRFTGPLTITTTGSVSLLDFPTNTTLPSAPAAGKTRIYAIDDHGFGSLEAMTDLGITNRINRDTYRIIMNDTGGSVSKGQLVYISSGTASDVKFKLAKADSVDTMPAIGIAKATIADQAYGEIMLIGVMHDIKTDYGSMADGERLYVSATTAGAYTNVEPTHPNLSQWIGTIENAATVANHGRMIVKIQAVLGTDDGTTSQSYKVGTGTNLISGSGSKLNGVGFTNGNITAQAWVGKYYGDGTGLTNYAGETYASTNATLKAALDATNKLKTDLAWVFQTGSANGTNWSLMATSILQNPATLAASPETGKIPQVNGAAWEWVDKPTSNVNQTNNGLYLFAGWVNTNTVQNIAQSITLSNAVLNSSSNSLITASNALSQSMTNLMVVSSNALQQSMSNTVDYASNVVWLKAMNSTNNNLHSWANTTTNTFRTTFISAGAMLTNGCAAGPSPAMYMPTNAVHPAFDVWDFDGANPETNYWCMTFPDSWDTNGYLRAKIYYLNTAIVADTSNVWAISCAAYSVAQPIYFAYNWGQEVKITNANVLNTNHLNIATTGVFLPSGHDPGDFIAFRLRRLADDGWDDDTGDSRLLGVAIQWTDKRNNTTVW